jgi:GMP synthase-like glutamine amidotransferase
MRPIAIFRHAPSEGPGYFASYLERKAITWRLVPLDAGQAVPRSARGFAGLVFMGGPMSVNDDLPWINPVLHLIADAVRQDVPVLGHCLGGQLVARAFGGEVRAAPVTLRSLRIGQLELYDLPASVGESPGSLSLLGMTFLKRFESYEVRGDTLILSW